MSKGPAGAEVPSADPAAPALRPPERSGPIIAVERTIEGRLARIHLRGGLIALARSELEVMAGRGALDEPALADLAEARWRSGDLVGAGEAAEAHIGGGGGEVVALVIAAEALAARGRLSDARRLAARALADGDAGLERLFGGQSRSSVWPKAGDPGAIEEVVEGAAEEGSEEGSVQDQARTMARDRETSAGLPIAVELERLEEDMAAGRIGPAATGLALLLRADHAAAPAILTLAARTAEEWSGDGQEAAMLHLVCGDAYRLLGRELEALAAYRRSHDALNGAAGEASPGERTEEST